MVFTSSMTREAGNLWRVRAGLAPLQAPPILLLLLYIVSGIILGCRAEPPPAPPPITVVAEAVRQETVPIYTDYVGRTEASRLIEIRARVDGFLERRAFREGSMVQKGDLLFVIDPRRYEANVRRLEAQLAREQATLAKAERDLARLGPLYERNAASQLDYDTALSAREQAVADLQSAEAQLDEARLELSYTRIEAPITGLVGAREVSIGTLVGSKGTSLLTTVQATDPMFVNFNMTASEYLEIRRSVDQQRLDAGEDFSPGDLVNIYLPDGSRYPYIGDIGFASPSVNPRTGTFQVRAQLPNPERLLLPGQYVLVSLLRSFRRGAILVPEKAVLVEQGGAYVFVVRDDGTVAQRFVEQNGRYGNAAIIDAGLRAGEQVVVEGMHKIEHGDAVEVVPPTAESLGADAESAEATDQP